MLKVICYGSSSKGNTFQIINNDTNIVIDLGVKNIINKLDFSKVDGILLTHSHGDHASQTRYVKDYYNGKFYGNKETLDKLPVIEAQKQVVNYKEPFEIGTFKIVPFQVYHDVPNNGYLIRDLKSGAKILFIIDTSNITNLHFTDLDYIFIESNYSYEWLDSKEELDFKDRRLYDTHLACEDTIEFLLNNINHNTKQIILTHISSSCDNYLEMQEKVKSAINNENIEVIAINPHLEEPLEVVLKKDLEGFDFD